MRIAIYGATGSVGRTLLVHMLKGTDLLPGDEIILVGREDSSNFHKLLAMKTDLLDAFDAGLVTLSVCSTLHDLHDVDVFVMAAGATFSERRTRRSDLAEDNRPLFHDVAKDLSKHCPGAFCLIISNPVELAVGIFCRYFERQLVVGIGAQQDSLRFARAVAASIGLPRQAIRASVLGEHGPGMVPLWSSIILVDGDPDSIASLEELKLSSSQDDRPELLKDLQNQLMLLILEERFPEAQRMLDGAQPDLRILVEPFLTVKILGSTPNATANATLDCIAAIRCGDSRTVHGQVLVEGEFYELNGIFGAPLALRRTGWTIGTHLPLTSSEVDRLRQVSNDIEKEHFLTRQ